MRLALIVLLPFVGALLPLLLARGGRTVCAMATAIITLMALGILATYIPEVADGGELVVRWSWIAPLGLNFSLAVNGWSLLLAMLILGIGILVTLYARAYLKPYQNLGLFFTYLLLFQGSMVGVALADNLWLLVIFWELTSLISFLLIGFQRDSADGRQGARMALAITGLGGLALTGGCLILGQIAGTFELSEIWQHRERIQKSPWYSVMVGCIWLGCLTKSAQVPFHFWLPKAMAAPTPVSAYLHSATLVKAGVFLLARLWPVLSGTELWIGTLVVVGVATMLWGGYCACRQTDLKALLAYSTVSHLGIMVFLLGLSTESALVAAQFHLLNHALFKAALFLLAGALEYSTGTRDLRRLGGVAEYLPGLFFLTVLALAANAGIPPLNGFLSKELMLEEAWHWHGWGGPWLLGSIATVGGALAVAYSWKFLVGVFGGRPRSDWPENWRRPGPGIWIPPTLLVVAAVASGLFPKELAVGWIRAAAASLVGLDQLPKMDWKLWHGWTPALISSIVAVGAGVLIGWGVLARERGRGVFGELDVLGIFERQVERGVNVSRWITRGCQPENFSSSLAWMLAAMIVWGMTAFAAGAFGPGTLPLTPGNGAAVVLTGLLIAACSATIYFRRQRLVALISANVVGLLVCIGFIYFSAPDLALTQIAVEVVTVIVLLLALYFWPKESREDWHWGRQLRDGGLALAAGAGLAFLTWAVSTREGNSQLAEYFKEQSRPGGGGGNIVNVILVDFRGFDTFMEVCVLGIAALVIYSLLDGAMHGPAAGRLDQWQADQTRTKEKHPQLMMVATRVMLPLALMVGTYFFLRGHNQPGGGFVAGLVITIALIMQHMVSGYDWAARRIPMDYHAWIAVGVLLAAGTGVGAMVMDFPFLTSAHDYLYLPWLGKLELASAMVFDAGVMLTVIGAVMLTLANLARMGRRADQASRRRQRTEDANPVDSQVTACSERSGAQVDEGN